MQSGEFNVVLSESGRQVLEQDVRAILTETDPDALRRQAAEISLMTVAGIVLLAACVHRAKELQFPEEEIQRMRLFRCLDNVACGQVIPELIIAAADRPDVLNRLTRMPIDVQKRFVAGEGFKVLELDGTHRLVPASAMTAAQAKQVFDRNRMRSEAEQAQYLSDCAKLRQRTEIEECPVSTTSRGLVVNGILLPWKQLEFYIDRHRNTKSKAKREGD